MINWRFESIFLENILLGETMSENNPAGGMTLGEERYFVGRSADLEK